MAVLLQAVLSGLAAGAVLGLVALGFTVVAGTARVLDLAHGDLVVAGVLLAVLAVLGRTPVSRDLPLGTSLLFAALALVTGGLLASAVAFLVVRPALPDARRGRRGDPVGWVVGGAAASLAVRAVLGVLLPAQAYAVPDPLHLDALGLSVQLPGGVRLPARVLPVLVLALLAGLAAERLLVLSRTGRALRAVADDPEAAQLCGVPAWRVVVVAFVGSGVLAGLAGLLYAPERSVSVDAGVVLGLSGIAAALLGGLGSARGALAGGLALGVAQSVVVAEAGGAWNDVVPLGVLVVALAVGPRASRARAVL